MADRTRVADNVAVGDDVTGPDGAFRQLGPDDVDAYAPLIQQAYAQVQPYGVQFAAVTASVDTIRTHLRRHLVLGYEVNDRLAATATVRLPWSPWPGPTALPHLSWVATHPDFAQRGFARQMLAHVEQHVLSDCLRSPAVTLGTADRHPWLVTMYESMGYTEVGRADLGKGHITIYMLKVLDQESFASVKHQFQFPHIRSDSPTH